MKKIVKTVNTASISVALSEWRNKLNLMVCMPWFSSDSYIGLHDLRFIVSPQLANPWAREKCNVIKYTSKKETKIPSRSYAQSTSAAVMSILNSDDCSTELLTGTIHCVKCRCGSIFIENWVCRNRRCRVFPLITLVAFYTCFQRGKLEYRRKSWASGGSSNRDSPAYQRLILEWRNVFFWCI